MAVQVPAGLTAADERHHPPGDGTWWGESWYFDFAAPDGSLGGYVRIGTYPHQGAIWYWACLVGEGRQLVTVVDHEVPPPRRQGLEIRHEGLWADHVIEQPFDHVTVGCEAFAVGLDDPAEAYGPMWGDRVPFGLDLEWETAGVPYAYPGGVTRYEIPCVVHGEILVGDEVIAFDGLGQRDHSWGPREWWSLGWTWTAGWVDEGGGGEGRVRFHGTVVRDGDAVLPFHPGYAQRDGAPGPVDHTAVATVFGADGFPASAVFEVGDTPLEVVPLAWAPVLLTAPDGRVSRFARALCRFTAGGGGEGPGATGYGWTEWNLPQ